MAGAAELFAKISAYKPPTWSWAPGGGARQWLDALCSGFVSLWAAGTLVPYTWPGSGPEAHTHAVLAMASAIMLAPLTALGYGGTAPAHHGQICGAVAPYVQANLALSVSPVALVAHQHVVSGCGSGGALKSAILGALSVSGPHTPDLMHAIAYGIVDFVVSYGVVNLSVAGNPHTHTLSS